MKKLCTVFDLSVKEIINLRTGTRLGYAGDVLIDPLTGSIYGLVVPGKYRVLGLMGREEDAIIPWESIEKIGDDVILTDFEPKKLPEKGKNLDIWPF